MAKMNEKDARILHYVEALEQPAVAIFDIGTHGARVLIAPKVVPERWDKSKFCLVGDELNLGAAVDSQTDILRLGDNSFRTLLNWMARRCDTLKTCGIEDVSIIGTAVFRWLDNKDEVCEAIRQKTGLRVEIIPEYREAELTMLALPTFLSVVGRDELIRDDDYAVLIDQGGGSTEISWIRWADLKSANPTPELRLYDELGTVALEAEFFERNAAGEYVEAEMNGTGIKAQYDRLNSFVRRVALRWRGGPKSGQGRHYVYFGLGSALSKITPGGNVHLQHLKQLSIAEIDQKAEESYRQMLAHAGDIKQVRSLFKVKGQLEDASRGDRKKKKTLKDFGNSLLKMYGLPALSALMKRCNADKIHFCGYGLAYSFYVEKYLRESPVAPEPYNTRGDNAGPYVFVSYAHEDRTIAYRLIEELQRRNINVWYDRGLVAGDDWKDVAAKNLANCSAFLLITSPDAIASVNVLDELKLADNRKKQIVEFRVRPIESMPYEYEIRLGSKIYVSWSARSFKHYEELQRSIESLNEFSSKER